MAQSAVSTVLGSVGNLAVRETTFLCGVTLEVGFLKDELMRLQAYLRDADSKRRSGKRLAFLLPGGGEEMVKSGATWSVPEILPSNPSLPPPNPHISPPKSTVSLQKKAQPPSLRLRPLSPKSPMAPTSVQIRPPDANLVASPFSGAVARPCTRWIRGGLGECQGRRLPLPRELDELKAGLCLRSLGRHHHLPGGRDGANPPNPRGLTAFLSTCMKVPVHF